MAAYLQTFAPRRSQFRVGRRAKPTGCICVHTAESAPDEIGPDDGAENVARFIRNRTDAGSYHVLCDSDSTLQLVPFEWEAYQDGTGSNAWAIGISLATQAARWPTLNAAWRDNAVTNLALAACDAALWLRASYGIIVPAKRITREESERGLPGFISHGERDPGRRSDPGAQFPWDQFLERYAYFAALNGLGAASPDEAPAWQGSLLPTQSIKSGSGRYTLIHQGDGNVVLYEDNLRAIWSTGTQGLATDVLVMQGDGNLVLYGSGVALWSSGTWHHPGSALVVQNDGNLVIYAPGSKPVWDRKQSLRPTIRLGSSGEHVTYCQQRLNAHGFSLTVDGDFGRITDAKVVSFQGSRRLTRDGVVGPRTWGALG